MRGGRWCFVGKRDGLGRRVKKRAEVRGLGSGRRRVVGENEEGS